MDVADLQTLISVADGGSLSAAAKRAGVAVSTVARRLTKLEAALNLRLLDRRADGVRLTADGARIAALAAPLGDQIAALVRAAEGLRAGSGPALVRVSATEAVISEILAPALPSLLARAPGVIVELRSQADLVSLAGREADLAIRMARPQGASLLAKRLPDIGLGLFAAPAWLAGRDPATIDLAAGPLLTYDDSFGRLPELGWLDRLGLGSAIRLRTGSTRALVVATQAGAGIGLLPRRFGGGLVEIATREPAPVRTPWLLTHRDLRRVPAVAAVHRWIVTAFDAG